MPIQQKPLFRLDALRPKLDDFPITQALKEKQLILAKWRDFIASAKIDAHSELSILSSFFEDVFRDVLGYSFAVDNPHRYTFSREQHVQVDGKFADGAIGVFNGDAKFIAAVEGKGPLDPLDRPFAGRKMSAVDQGFRYAINLKCDWVIVTNLKEIRLYYKGNDYAHFEQFEVAQLARDLPYFKRFVFVFGCERVVKADGSCHLPQLLSDTERIGKQVTVEFYSHYAGIRHRAFEQLCTANPETAKPEILKATQKLLDRVLFCTFAENRGLLPAKTVSNAYAHKDPYHRRPIWDNFRGLFKSIDAGNSDLEIEAYNGGLFAFDELLDAHLNVPDGVCQSFTKLAEYDYREGGDGSRGRPVDVEILGHIFEQSITDLERLHDNLAGRTRDDDPTKGRRKKEGAFYTPAFITRYIVAQTLKPVLDERLADLQKKYRDDAPLSARKLFEGNLHEELPDKLTKPQREALKRFWQEWQDVLAKIRILDPACGSGAFLIEAFNQLHRAYDNANGRLRDLGEESLFDPDQRILQQNLYGVDLNEEAIEICRLSLWVKTAKHGEKLTSLDHTIRVGNSIVSDPAFDPKAFDWQLAFPEVAGAGGFDVVVANPPYVRQEWIAPIKPYLQLHYRAYDGVADLYIYFYELALNRLKPGGRMGFVVTNKWMKAGYAENLRRLFSESAWVESVIDFGHAKQIFPDADVFPCILVARKPDTEPEPTEARVCAIPREQLRIDDLSRQITEEGFPVPRLRLRGNPWSLEPPAVDALIDKIRSNGVSLKEYAKIKPLSGIKTACNEAYLIDTATYEALVKADPKSREIFKRYVRGQDINRWNPAWAGLWMIAMKSSGDHRWPWADAGDRGEEVFAATHPALYQHFQSYSEALHKRQDKGRYWWELRSCAYWDEFEKPKIIYGEITWRAEWAYDTIRTYSNNTVYILPTNDFWILACVNSPIMWWFSWRNAVHGKDEALRFIRDFTETLPIPKPKDFQKQTATEKVLRLIQIAEIQQGIVTSTLDWLRVEYAIDKPTQKLANLLELNVEALIAEVRKIRGKKSSLSVASLKNLREEHARTIAPAREHATEALQLERQLSDLVNEAYGLTPDEVALMWKTTPPRMPFDSVANTSHIT